MRDTLRHRGPDDEGLYVAPGIGLGFRRLSIIDLAGGHQPIANEDDSVWLTYNGEIYNFKELREDLIRAGHSFRTRSDSEVIVHLYEEHGPACVDLLRGMFAFALYDRSRHRLLLARDRVGIKPLYYRIEAERVLFGSEPRAILAHMKPGQVEIDPDVVGTYFSLLYVPDDSSAYRGIQRLAPGHRLLVDGPDPEPRRYWQAEMPVEPTGATRLEDITARIRARIEEAVRVRLVSDVPLGAFLSGGLDSSTVVGCMAGMIDQPVKTFTISFDEAPYDESEPARATAARWNTDHHELRLGPDSWKTVETLAGVYDEPFGDPSAIPTYLVSRFARETVTVALSGDGGDELFAGYHRYRHLKQLEQMRSVPRWARAAGARLASGRRAGRILERSLLPFPDNYFAGESFLVPELTDVLRSNGRSDLVDRGYALYRAHARKGDAVAAAQIIDLETYLPGDILTKVDRASMANSLEVRVPLLDHLLIEEVFRLATDIKLRGYTGKFLLRKACGDLLTPQLLGRRKQGFGVPIKEWFAGPLRPMLLDTLLSRACLERGYYEPQALRRLIDEHLSGRRNRHMILYGLLMFELWLHHATAASRAHDSGEHGS